MAHGGHGGPHRGGSLLGAVKRVLASLGEITRTRLELLSIEVQEEGARFVRLLALVAIAIGFLALAVLVLTLFVVVLFWDTYRLQAIAGMALLYLLIAGLAALALRRRLSGTPRPFSATLAELRKDYERLRS